MWSLVRVGARGANSNFRRTLLETQFQQGFDDFVIYTEKSQIRHLKDVDDNANNKVKNFINNLAKRDHFPIYKQYYCKSMKKLSWRALNLDDREIAFHKILLLWGHPNPFIKNSIRAKKFVKIELYLFNAFFRL